MGTEERPRASDLSALQSLADDPNGYHIYQALRIIEAAYADNPRLGRSLRPSDDPIRLHQEVEMTFAPSTISEVVLPEDGQPGRLTSRFFGLFGPQGPMPGFFTEYVRDRKRNNRDDTLADFVNMFSHRMMSLLYRAWASAEPAPSFDRVGSDDFSDKVDAIAGYRGLAFSNSDLMPDLTKRQFAAHLASGTNHVEGIEALLSAFFDAPVEIEDFIGSWLEFEPDDRWALGGPARLGRNTSIGDRCWTRSAKFRIRIGPLSFEDYRRLLPGNGSLERLREILRNYVGDTIDWELNLVLKAEDVPEAELGKETMLGMTSWSGPRADASDADDFRITPAISAAEAI